MRGGVLRLQLDKRLELVASFRELLLLKTDPPEVETGRRLGRVQLDRAVEVARRPFDVPKHEKGGPPQDVHGRGRFRHVRVG